MAGYSEILALSASNSSKNNLTLDLHFYYTFNHSPRSTSIKASQPASIQQISKLLKISAFSAGLFYSQVVAGSRCSLFELRNARRTAFEQDRPKEVQLKLSSKLTGATRVLFHFHYCVNLFSISKELSFNFEVKTQAIKRV